LEEGMKAIGDTAGDWNKNTLKQEFEKALKKLSVKASK